MQIQNITIIARGTKGEVIKAVFDLEGKCLSGNADIKEIISQQAADLADGAGDDSGSDDSGSHAADTGDHEGAVGSDAGALDTGE